MGGSPNPSSILDFLMNQNQGNQPPSPLAPQQDSPAAPQAPPSTPAPPPQPAQQAAPQSPAQAQAGGIKGYLSNIFYGMGEAAKAHLGMETDVQVNQKQQALDIQKQQANANAFEKQSEAKYRESMTAMNAPGPITDQQEAETLGLKVGDMISPGQKFALYKAKLDGMNKNAVAQTAANARLGAAQITALSRMSQTTMKAAYMPDGTLGVGLYDKAGNFRGYADNAVVPADYLEKIHHGQEFKVDASGTLQAIPTTSTSAPLVPQPPKPNQLIQGPQAPDPKANLQNILQNGPQQPAAPSPAITPPKVTPGALRNAAQAKAVTSAKPVTGADGQPFQAPTAADPVYATDPKTGQQIFTNRASAVQQGLQNPQKVSVIQTRKDQALSNNLADVQRKVGDFQDTFAQPIDNADRVALQYVMDNHLAGNIHDVNLLPGYVQGLLRTAGIGKLSEAGMNRLILYKQAEESLTGLQQAKTGSSKSSDKVLELHISQLPNPTSDTQFANAALSQFQTNIDLAGQHMPIFPGPEETQQSVKAQQIARRAQAQQVQNNQNNPQAYINQHNPGAQSEPPRPATVPSGYVFQQNGPKGAGWYRP